MAAWIGNGAVMPRWRSNDDDVGVDTERIEGGRRRDGVGGHEGHMSSVERGAAGRERQPVGAWNMAARDESAHPRLERPESLASTG